MHAFLHYETSGPLLNVLYVPCLAVVPCCSMHVVQPPSEEQLPTEIYGKTGLIAPPWRHTCGVKRHTTSAEGLRINSLHPSLCLLQCMHAASQWPDATGGMQGMATMGIATRATGMWGTTTQALAMWAMGTGATSTPAI